MLGKLPEECWELILKLLIDDDDHPYSHFNSLSLVCKQFLSLTNGILFTLKLSNRAVEALLPRLLQRFRCLKHIDLTRYNGDVNSILHQIALFRLNHLESLNISYQTNFPEDGIKALGGSETINLKSLCCANISCLCDSDLSVIAESFPCLEDLDISNQITYYNRFSDSGIHSLSLKLKSLRKINLSGLNCSTDNSLAFLSANCFLLSQVVINHCNRITLHAIAKFIRDCRHLNSLSISGIHTPLPNSAFQDSLGSCKAFSAIEFTYSDISDEFLNKVAQAHFPLEKLVLSCCYKFSFSGISTLLEKYQTLEHLDLNGATVLTDKKMAVLCRFLHSIKSINLSRCKRLTGKTFYSRTRKCLNLNDIGMRGTNIGNENIKTNCNSNFVIKSLDLAQNRSMGDDFLRSVASICPNLEMLKLSQCNGVTEEGIADVLKKCSEIRQLKVDHNKVMNNVFIHLEFELPKLKILSLTSAGIGDDALAMIGKRCCSLLKLHLEFNMSLT